MNLSGLLLLAASGVAPIMSGTSPLLPDPALTPGDVLTTDAAVICRPGYSRTVRNVPQALKEQVYREYGIPSRAPGEFEVDHLISLELGGSNSLRNLWPQSFVTQPLNAHVKDALENRLHALACAGKLSFAQAQRAIAHNWEEAYVTYVGPLPGGLTPGRRPNQPTIPSTHVPSLPPGGTPDTQHPTMDVPILPGLPDSAPDTATPAPDSLPDMVPPAEAPAGPTPPDAQGGCPQEAPVKVGRSGIYHLPEGDANYAATRAVACFPDAVSAQAAGYRGTR